MRVHFDEAGRPDDVSLDDDVGLVLAGLERLAADGVVSGALRRLLTVVRTVSTTRMSQSAHQPEPSTSGLSRAAHDWMTPAQVAEMLDVALSTAKRFVKVNGEQFHGHWFVRRSKVEEEKNDRSRVQRRGGRPGGAPPGGDVGEPAPQSCRAS